MGFLNKFKSTRVQRPPPQELQVLTLAPAVMRMSVAGKDATTELEALATAVSKLRYPDGFSSERVFAAATELVRMITAGGVAALTDKMTADLAPEQRADAFRLALTAVFCLRSWDSSDIGILAGMAKQVAISDASFEALYEEAKAHA